MLSVVGALAVVGENDGSLPVLGDDDVKLAIEAVGLLVGFLVVLGDNDVTLIV